MILSRPGPLPAPNASNSITPKVLVAAFNPCLDIYCDGMRPGFDPKLSFSRNKPYLVEPQTSFGSNGMNVFRFAQTNFEDTELETHLITMLGQPDKNSSALAAQTIRGHLTKYSDNVTPVPVTGDNRVHYYDREINLIRGAQHLLQPSPQDIAVFLRTLESMLKGSRILYLDGMSPGYLDVYQPIQEMAKNHGVGIVADTRDKFLKQILINTESAQTDKIKGLKLNLKEFCDLMNLRHQNIEEQLAHGDQTGFEEIITPLGIALTQDYIREDNGVFILSCGGYPLYFFRPNLPPIRVTFPNLPIISPTGCGDSMVGMAMYYLANDRPITKGIAKRIAATGLATALQPQTDLAKTEDIEALLAKGGIIAQVYPWTGSKQATLFMSESHKPNNY